MDTGHYSGNFRSVVRAVPVLSLLEESNLCGPGCFRNPVVSPVCADIEKHNLAYEKEVIEWEFEKKCSIALRSAR